MLLPPLPPLVLASGSPRRRELLQRAGFEFRVQPSDAPEDVEDQTPAPQVPLLLAQRKAWALRKRGLALAHELVLAADTVVDLDGRLLNKPGNADEARHMLKLLSGRCHQVHTGVCLLHQDWEAAFVETTRVCFAVLAEADIEAYVRSGDPMDKAGAYGVQSGLGLRAVHRIEGDFYTVMGLPVARICRELQQRFSLNLP